jgi:hypothetical protein
MNTQNIAEVYTDTFASIGPDAWVIATHMEQLGDLHIPAEIDHEKGNCYGAALWVAHALVQRWPEWEQHLRLVHAEVQGNDRDDSKTRGKRFGHGYLTLTVPFARLRLAIDYANRQRIVLPLDYYEHVGRIRDIDNRHEYTYGEAIRHACRTRHYGPWELVTRSGL